LGAASGSGSALDPPLALRLLGPFDVRLHGEPLPRLRTRKGEWLLALLVLRHGRGVEREWLTGKLWPESAASQGAASLRRSLTDLRRCLGPEGGRLRSPSPHILTLDLTGAFVDVLAFDAALARGETASLRDAVALYRGPLLEGCMEDWVLPERQAREEAYLGALEQLGAAALARGDALEAIVLLRRAAAADPLRESAQRLLMQALAVSGDTPAATLVYRELRLRLHRELNAEPDPDTTALFHELRARAKARAEATGRSPDMSADPHPSRSAPPPLHLPRPLTDFVGRRREVEEVLALLETRRLVTLAGPGGIGKTRLSLQVAEEAAPQIADGVWFIDLAPLRDAALVARAVAAALGVHDQPDRRLEDALIDSAREREMLLVLDNCEHLVDACAPLAEALLSQAPGLRILATSRQALGITGEVDWRVPSLSLPEEESSIGRPVGTDSEAVQLFVQRGQAARADFAVTERNAAAVVRVCRRLDGIPLALELAAARLKLLTVEQVAARLDHRFELLTSGSRTALPRQRTLRATLDWSYELLDDAERRLLRRLSVFPGRFSLDAAEAVCSGCSPAGTHDLLDLLTGLVDKSLVAVEAQAGEARYRLLETTREYARERLGAAGEEAALRQRHADYFLSLAEAADAMLSGPEAAEWSDRLEAVTDDLRAAVEWWASRAAERDREPALRMVTTVWRFWRSRYVAEGDVWPEAAASSPAIGWTEVLRWLEQLLAAAPPGSAAAAQALHYLGRLFRWRGDLTRARSLMEQSLEIYEQREDLEGIATTLANLGIIRRDTGDLDLARELLERGLALNRRLGNRVGTGSCLSHLGMLAYHQGDHATARALHEESVMLHREIGTPLGIARALTDLGVAAGAAGDYPAAHAAHAESLEIFQKLRHRVHIAWSLSNVAATSAALGDVTAALTLYRRGLAIFAEMRHSRGVAGVLIGIAEITLRNGSGGWKAARLLSAAQALRASARVQVDPRSRAELDQIVDGCRAALGEEEFAAAWEEGQAMTPEQAAASALEEDTALGAAR
jgi:predicted ATPase/DNA-binding SARP family transcriptional activator